MNKAEIMTEVENFCKNQKWKYNLDEDCLYTGFCIKPGGVQYRTIIMVRENGILVYVYVPVVGISGGSLDSIVCRLNEGVVNGNFEIERGSSKVRYKIYLSCVGVESMIGEMLLLAIELALKMVVLNEGCFA